MVYCAVVRVVCQHNVIRRYSPGGVYAPIEETIYLKIQFNDITAARRAEQQNFTQYREAIDHYINRKDVLPGGWKATSKIQIAPFFDVLFRAQMRWEDFHEFVLNVGVDNGDENDDSDNDDGELENRRLLFGIKFEKAGGENGISEPENQLVSTNLYVRFHLRRVWEQHSTSNFEAIRKRFNFESFTYVRMARNKFNDDNINMHVYQ